MEIVELKFSNLKMFVSEKAGSSIFVALFLQSSLDTFLQTVHTHTSNGLTKKQIMERILEKLGTKKTDYSVEDWEKFSRYTQYFVEVAKTYYD